MLIGDSLSSTAIRQGIITAAGIAAAAFIGYCIYFDHKRRSAPDYKKKIREQRRAVAAKAKPLKPTPNFSNPTEMQAYFLQEVQLGEEFIAEGHIEDGIEHLCNAITMCGQPAQLIQIFQQTLPSEHFSLLMQKLPEAKARLMRVFSEAGQGERANGGSEAGNAAGTISTIALNDDLELE